MNDNLYPSERPVTGLVRLGDRVVSMSDLKSHPDRFLDLFVRARAEHGHAECLCRPRRPARLVIRRRNGRYHLARWPDRGHLHAPGCLWYRSDPALSGRSAYTADAIVTTDAGTSLRLAIPLIARSPTTRSVVSPTGPSTTSAPNRRALTLLALLHWAWEEAGLSVWHPAPTPRTWATCHTRLDTHLHACAVNGIAPADALYIVPPYRPRLADRNAAAFTAFASRLGRDGDVQRYGLLLGEIREISPTRYGIRITLGHLRRPLFASQALHDRLTRSYPAVFAAAGSGRRIAVCLVSRSRQGYVLVHDMAAMVTSTAYVPVDSSYEQRIADALVAAGRVFLKPLRYDRTSAVFPDFVLLDTNPRTYIEVWGIHGREGYERRKQAKQIFYRSTGTPVIEWNTNDPLPSLSRIHRVDTAEPIPRPPPSRS